MTARGHQPEAEAQLERFATGYIAVLAVTLGALGLVARKVFGR